MIQSTHEPREDTFWEMVWEVLESLAGLISESLPLHEASLQRLEEVVVFQIPKSLQQQ